MAKKLYYKIGEACKLLDIQPYVLRYWETEFPFLKPSKSKSGQRVYSEQEISTIRRIKELLYEEGYTIAGAKKKLEADLEEGGGSLPDPPPDSSAKGSPAKTKTDGRKSKTVAPKLDNEAQKKIETYRGGIESALSQAREILTLLDSKVS